MPIRTVYDCDACPNGKDLGYEAQMSIYEPRQPGEMDGGSVGVILCPACLRKFVLAAVNHFPPGGTLTASGGHRLRQEGS